MALAIVELRTVEQAGLELREVHLCLFLPLECLRLKVHVPTTQLFPAF